MKFDAYILSGGKSRRMGSDKALKLFQGKTFLDQVAFELGKVSPSVKVVANHQKYVPLGYASIADNYQEIGPLAGIETALKDSSTEYTWIVSCDSPAVTSRFFEWLFSEWNKGTDAVYPIVNGKALPLMGIFKTELHSYFENLIHTGERRVMKTLQSLNCKSVEVPLDLEHQLYNINTQEELDKLEAQIENEG